MVLLTLWYFLDVQIWQAKDSYPALVAVRKCPQLRMLDIYLERPLYGSYNGPLRAKTCVQNNKMQTIKITVRLLPEARPFHVNKRPYSADACKKNVDQGI